MLKADELPAKPLETLLQVFHDTFKYDYKTCLKGGGEEPLYKPAGKGDYACITFTRDYFSSALHEVAHWCVAGSERRKLEDYGYWYAADGRSAEQQVKFESVEIVPQAIEWMFSVAAGVSFRVSVDNLSAQMQASPEFRRKIWQQAREFCQSGLPERAYAFTAALTAAFSKREAFNKDYYLLADI